MEAPLEPTQEELVVIASEEAGFSNTVDVGRFVRTRAVCDVRGRSIASCCKDLPNLDSGVNEKRPGNNHVLDVFVSTDQCLFCMDIEVSSPVCIILHGQGISSIV